MEDNVQTNKNLKNTIELDDGFYNINAVEADVAKKTQAALALEPSFGSRTDLEDKYKGSFDGNEAKAIKYVPADGGVFTGTVQINKGISNVNSTGPDDIINKSQMETVISKLDGAPLYTWDASTGYNAVKNDKEEDYKLNTVVGSVEDLPVFEAYSNGQAHNLYVMPDSYDNAYITYSNAHFEYDNGTISYDAYFNLAYKDVKNSITKLIFKGEHTNKENFKADIRIRGSEFYNMPNLASVHLNPGVVELGTSAFSNCPQLSSIAIPDSLEIVGKEAFKGCTGLTSIVLGSNIKEIKAAAFSGCKNLKSIAICNNDVTIASDAFSGCTALKTIYFKTVENGKEWNTNLTNIAITGATANANVVPIDSTAFPFLYICKGPKGEDTSLTSNKMFLKLPNEPLVEISKGAARLERRDSKPSNNTDYFTYDVLAAVIAGINSRITALGSKALALPTKLATDTEYTVIPDTLITSEQISEELQQESSEVLIDGKIDVPSVFDLAQDIDDLKVELLDGVAGNYATKTVGGVSAGSQIDGNITVSNLLKQILGISAGVAPSGFSFSIKSTNSNTNSITAPLDQTSETIKATWSVSDGGTYTGKYTPTIGGVTGTAAGKSGGTIDITVTFTGADTSKSISGSATYTAGTGFSAGTLNGDSKSLTINRTCYYGPSSGTLSSTARTSKNNWAINQNTALANDYFIIQYPKAWGKLSSITDNDTGYEAVANSETFNNTPTEVTKNGGTYYQYKTNNKLSGKLSFKVNS